MQEMLDICDEFACEFDMKFNTTKSVAMRIGSRYNIQCLSFVLSGTEIKYVSAVKYLGIYVVAAKCFKLSIDHLKVKFYRVFNCIFKTNNIEIVNACREQFSFQLPSVVLLRRKEKLESNVLTVFRVDFLIFYS